MATEPLKSELQLWSSLLICAASQDVFFTSITNKHCIVQHQHRLGWCKALFDPICVHHPACNLCPMPQRKCCPSQHGKQTISDFFDKRLQHLCLCAHVEDISANLNDPQECDTFIGLLKRSKEILDLTCDKQASRNPAKIA